MPHDLKIKSPEEMWAGLRQTSASLEAKGFHPMTINFDVGDAHYQKLPTLKVEFPYPAPTGRRVK